LLGEEQKASLCRESNTKGFAVSETRVWGPRITVARFWDREREPRCRKENGGEIRCKPGYVLLP